MRIIMLMKRWWWWGRCRARVLVRRPPVLAACCFLISVFLLLSSVVVVDRAEPESHASLFVKGEQDGQPQSRHSQPHNQDYPQQNHHLPTPPSSSSMVSPPPSRSSSLALPVAGSLVPQNRHELQAFSARENVVEHDSANNNGDKFVAHKSRITAKSPTDLNSVHLKSHSYHNRASTNSKTSVRENNISDFGSEGKSGSSPGKSSSPRSGWLDMVQGLVRGERTVNPGMLLGAVAALKTFRSAGEADDSPLKPVMGVVQAVRQAMFPQPQESGHGLPDSQGFLKPEFKSKEVKTSHMNVTGNHTQLLGKRMDLNELNAKDHSFQNKSKSNYLNNDTQQSSFNLGNIQKAVGVIGSLMGEGSAGKPGRQSVVGSLMTNLASPLLAGAFSDNNNKAGTSSSPLQSLVNGLGPVLLNGIIQQGFGRDNSAPRNADDMAISSPFQAFMSKMGPSLLAGAVQHGFSAMQGGQRSQGGDQNSSPLQSVLSGLAPALIAGLTQGNMKQGQNSRSDKVSQTSNPMQSIILGLAPALVAGALGQGFGNAMTKSSPETGKSSDSKPLMNGLRSTNLPATVQTKLGKRVGGKKFRGSLHEVTHVRDAERVASGDARKRSGRALQVDNSETKRKLRELNPRTEDDDHAGETFHDNSEEIFHDNIRVRNGAQANATEVDRNNENEEKTGGDLVRVLAKAVVGNLVPEELQVPEPNSTRGVWNMAVNLAFGNPKDDKGRKSEFWKWLREYGGGAGGAPTPPQWITDALHNPQRAAHAIEMGRVFEMMEVPQPVCTNVKSVGGVFNWKTNVLDGARAVCMDADVSPQREGCVVYSFGIRGKLNFEEDMERMGCKVWVFDPSTHRGSENPRLHFHSVGLAPVNTTRLVDGKEWNLLPFSSVVEQMGHLTTTIDYLKMDIQGDEWQVLQEVMRSNRHALTNVKQLGLEAHLEGALRDPALYKVYLDTFLGLESFGFQLFYSNENERDERRYEDPLLKRRVSPTYDLAFLRI
nr:uncharacterized protein LOC123770813 isoform X2 [Procambarus clarkii]